MKLGVTHFLKATPQLYFDKSPRIPAMCVGVCCVWVFGVCVGVCGV